MNLEVVTTSELSASPDAVWQRVSTLESVNDELWPWMRMTAPSGTELTVEAVPLGRRWFRSWVLLFGVIPFDYDNLCVERIEPGRGFLERSTMLSARIWEHERTLTQRDDGGTRVTDRVSFVPRLRAAAGLHRAVITALFRHRHRRLRKALASR